jgi:hypothetical protein
MPSVRSPQNTSAASRAKVILRESGGLSDPRGDASRLNHLE